MTEVSNRFIVTSVQFYVITFKQMNYDEEWSDIMDVSFKMDEGNMSINVQLYDPWLRAVVFVGEWNKDITGVRCVYQVEYMDD